MKEKGGDKMNHRIVCVGIIGISLMLFGCGKKQQSLEELQAPMSIETLGSMNSQNTATTPAAPVQAVGGQSAIAVPVASVTEVPVAVSAAGNAMDALPPAGPYQPAVRDIQTALKNAGFYSGNVDGKLGPRSKAAIQEFQKAHGLTADGKVGPKTWMALEKYLVAPAAATTVSN